MNTQYHFCKFGNGANEAMISSCVPSNGKLLVGGNGSYGVHLAQIVETYGIEMTAFKTSTHKPSDEELLFQYD